MTTEVALFVDGSCRGNPGPGGCFAILQAGGREKVLVDGADATTNNRMELTAVLTGLQALKRPCAVTVVTDSQYVAAILGGGQAKANRDLVQQVIAWQAPATRSRCNGWPDTAGMPSTSAATGWRMPKPRDGCGVGSRVVE